MAGQTSCIAHPAETWFFTLRLGYWGVTDHNHCAAAILSILEYRTNINKVEARKQKIDCDTWLTIDRDAVSDSLFGLFSATSVYHGLNFLAEKGFVTKETSEQRGRPCSYRLNCEVLNEALREWSKSAAGKAEKDRFHCYPGSISSRIKLHTGRIDLHTPRIKLHTGRIDLHTGILIDSKEPQMKEEEISQEGNPSTPSLQGQSFQTPPDPTTVLEDSNLQIYLSPDSGEPPSPLAEDSDDFTPQSDLRLEMDAKPFLRWAYSSKRRGTLKPGDVNRQLERIAELEAEYGVAEFRAGLMHFLDEESTWLREKKWPLAAYLKNPGRHIDSDSPRRAKTPTASSPAATYRQPSATEGPANDPAAILGQKENQDPVLQYVDKWNTINPDHPAGELMKRTERKVRDAAADPDFARVHEAVFAKVGKLIVAGQEMGFEWMFTGSKEPNWVGVHEGKWNWVLQKKVQPGTLDWEKMISETVQE